MMDGIFLADDGAHGTPTRRAIELGGELFLQFSPLFVKG